MEKVTKFWYLHFPVALARSKIEASLKLYISDDMVFIFYNLSLNLSHSPFYNLSFLLDFAILKFSFICPRNEVHLYYEGRYGYCLFSKHISNPFQSEPP
jgi:hypothetical protein